MQYSVLLLPTINACEVFLVYLESEPPFILIIYHLKVLSHVKDNYLSFYHLICNFSILMIV